ncbi:MAG TPA: single-stranded DNA-binding protein [Actinomycetes bacterium]
MPPTRADRATEADLPDHANEVRLVGRLAAEAVRRDLPSGDSLVSFRLVVERPPARRGDPAGRSSRSPTVDTLDCAAWRKDVQRVLARAAAGDVLEVHGALRRRFWRTGSGAASRSEVEAARVRRLKGREP